MMKSKEERELEKKIKEAKKKLGEQKEENRKKELLLRVFQVYTETGNFLELQKFTPSELKEVLELIDVHLKETKQKIEDSKKNEPTEDQATMVDDGATECKGNEPVVVKGGEGLEMIMEAVDETKIKRNV